MNRHFSSQCWLFCLTLLCLTPLSLATQMTTSPDNTPSKMKVDLEHIKTWNRFTDSLYQLHQQQLKKHTIYTTSNSGGYPTHKDYYTEVRYFDKDSKKLLSVIQWEKINKNNIHTIEIYTYDDQGRVLRDYLSAYLPQFRNAPIQTLINLHYYNDQLHSFRQFDASSALIYEQCEGYFFDQKVLLSIDEDEFNSDIIDTEEYLACFNNFPSTIGKYFNPLVEEPALIKITDISKKQNYSQHDDIQKNIRLYTANIKNKNKLAQNYLLRGNSYFKLHEFFNAVSDYDQAIKLANLDKAYFGRGLAKGRMGQLVDAISDLSIYIQRKPDDSVGYTKRGVRYLWLGEISKAKTDLEKAIMIDPNNAEAHDDLGVIYASQGNHKKATKHFLRTIYIDKYYQKAYHNLAMVHFITEKNHVALQRIEQAIQLNPNSRNSLILKSEILNSLGRDNEATAISDKAEFLPEGNWSEKFLNIKKK